MPDLYGILNLIKLLPFKPHYPNSDLKYRDMITAQLYGASWEKNSKHYPYHKYVWGRKEFCKELEKIGFEIILLLPWVDKDHFKRIDINIVNDCKNLYPQ